MIRIIISISGYQRAGMLLLALLVLLLTASIAPERPAIAQAEAPAVFIPQGGGRHFYLTDADYYPDQALSACASGYHMASFWEIYDVSNLVYDKDHPAAHKKADSGYGPPSYWHGWVRTGGSSSASSTTGTGNCSTWSTRSGNAYGVSVRLSNAWESNPGDSGPWDTNTFACNITGPVWCVGSFSDMYLPAIAR